MRTRTQRIEDRAGIDEHELGEAALEICRTIDDAAERLADKLDELEKFTRALDALIGALSKVRA